MRITSRHLFAAFPLWSALPRIALLSVVIASLCAISAVLADTVPSPVLVSPYEGELTTGESYPPLGNPIFVWEPVEGASNYEIEISRSIGFGTVEHRGITSSTKYVPTVSLADGTYYWHVRAYVGLDKSSYSPAQSFAKDWSNEGEILPMLLSPSDGTVYSGSGYPTFSWSPVPGAATYLFEISTNSQFSGAPAYSQSVIKPTHTPVTTLLGNGIYFWRVTPVDYRGNSGMFSEPSQFSLAWNYSPVLLAPVDRVELAFTPDFSWVAVPGASHYALQVSSESDFSIFDSYPTKNTAFTPVEPLSNDQEYYWRVQAVDAAGNNSAFSDSRSFTIRGRPPLPLTPVNTQIDVNSPVFSWAPVPGAKSYEIECDETPTFAEPLLIKTVEVFTTHYAHGDWRSLTAFPVELYWRVRALDDAGNTTDWSRPQAFTFGIVTAPTPIYPPYYYVPDSELTPVHGDPTIAYPLFIWDTAVDARSSADHFPGAAYYRLDVDDSPLFNSPNFSITTASQGVAPTTDNPFTDLQDGKIYYWRIRAFHEDDQPMGAEIIWRTRIDTSLPLIPGTDQITPMYPADGHEVVEHAPILGWQPVNGATLYHVQIATDPGFVQIVDEAYPVFINYVPKQGSTERLPNGHYYWRVRTAQPLGDWGQSEIRRFNINHHLLTGLPTYDYVLPNPISQDALNYIAEDPSEAHGDAELTGLYAAMERTVQRHNWVFALDVAAAITDDVQYLLYFDVDHENGVGSTSNPLGKSIAVAEGVYADSMLTIQRSATSGFDTVLFWEWSDTYGWGAPRSLSSMGGELAYYTQTHILELRMPFTALTGSERDWAGGVAVAVVSTSDETDGFLDSVPSNTPHTLAKFAYISDMLNPIYPFDTPLSNPMVHYDIPPMRWLMASWDSVDGYAVEVARDIDFTDVIDMWESYESGSGSLYSLIPNAFVPTHAYEDNETYYWRVKVRHERYTAKTTDFHYGPWSKPFRFKLDSRVPTNATASPTDSTPTFAWDRVEGVGAYRLQVAQDANFSDPLIDLDTAATSYTPSEMSSARAMSDGHYFWRLAIKRDRFLYGKWTPTMSFTKSSLAPVPLGPIGGQVVNSLPTFSWSEVLAPTSSPYVSSPQYKLVVADNPSFDKAKSYITSATTYTPIKLQKHEDGTWYWRVATYDRNRVEGRYSPVQNFYKEYLSPQLVSPQSGEVIESTPVFSWTPIDGAAYYEVEIDNNPAFSNVRSPVTTDNTSYVPTQDLGDSRIFYWRVRMVDADKVKGPIFGGIVNPYTDYVQLPSILSSAP